MHTSALPIHEPFVPKERGSRGLRGTLRHWRLALRRKGPLPLARAAVVVLCAVYLVVRVFYVPHRLNSVRSPYSRLPSGDAPTEHELADYFGTNAAVVAGMAEKWGPDVELYDFAHQTASSRNAALNGERLLLLMPLRNAESVLDLMFDHLRDLTYPHELIDLTFLVSDSTDNTYDELVALAEAVQTGQRQGWMAPAPPPATATGASSSGSSDSGSSGSTSGNAAGAKPFNRVDVYRHDFGATIGQGVDQRHGVAVQAERRKLMGRARNWLLGTALRPYHSWVYWRDADIERSPVSIIEDLMSHDRDVIVPNVWRPLPSWLGGQQPYDLNSWPESDTALDLASRLPEDDVIVEGYAEYPTYRVHLAYLRSDDGDQNELMDLDGIGGVSILAKARVFRAGTNFPGFAFKNHAETEGFGKMSREMGFSVSGLLHYTVWHKYEPSDDDLEKMREMEAQGLPID